LAPLLFKLPTTDALELLQVEIDMGPKKGSFIACSVARAQGEKFAQWLQSVDLPKDQKVALLNLTSPDCVDGMWEEQNGWR
jgi:hypothetical protein